MLSFYHDVTRKFKLCINGISRRQCYNNSRPIEYHRDNVFLWVNKEVRITLVPLTISQWDFSIDLWIIAENKICGKQKFRILTPFVQQDYLHR